MWRCYSVKVYVEGFHGGLHFPLPINEHTVSISKTFLRWMAFIFVCLACLEALERFCVDVCCHVQDGCFVSLFFSVWWLWSIVGLMFIHVTGMEIKWGITISRRTPKITSTSQTDTGSPRSPNLSTIISTTVEVVLDRPFIFNLSIIYSYRAYSTETSWFPEKSQHFQVSWFGETLIQLFQIQILFEILSLFLEICNCIVTLDARGFLREEPWNGDKRSVKWWRERNREDMRKPLVTLDSRLILPQQ